MFASTSNNQIVVTFFARHNDLAARNVEIRFLDSGETIDPTNPETEHFVDMACDLIADDFNLGNVYFA
jgi:hypothetical protein